MRTLLLVTILALGACDTTPQSAPAPSDATKPATGTPTEAGGKAGPRPSDKAGPATPRAKPATPGTTPAAAPRPNAAGPGNLDITARLRARDIQAATGTKDEFVPALLQGIKPSPTYGRARLAPVDRAHYGVGLQVWRVENAAKADKRLALHAKTYRGAAPHKGIGRAAILAKQHTIHHLSWIQKGDAEVLTLTCDERLCSVPQLLALAKRLPAN